MLFCKSCGWWLADEIKKVCKTKKGRGLGYMGAKRLISWAIGEEIEFQVPDFDIFVDAFGGGDTEKLYTLKDFELARQMDIFDYID